MYKILINDARMNNLKGKEKYDVEEQFRECKKTLVFRQI